MQFSKEKGSFFSLEIIAVFTLMIYVMKVEVFLLMICIPYIDIVIILLLLRILWFLKFSNWRFSLQLIEKTIDKKFSSGFPSRENSDINLSPLVKDFLSKQIFILSQNYSCHSFLADFYNLWVLPWPNLGPFLY